MRRRAHAMYLAVIVVLVVAAVYMAGRTMRASECAASIKARYGIDLTTRATPARPALLRGLSAEQLLSARTFDQYRQEFNLLVGRALELGDFDDRANSPDQRAAGARTLKDSCARALKGGKRLRPIILMEIARLASKRRHAEDQMPPIDPADAALAVECLHAGSIVVDDLPAFDNDAERRGEPSVWAATSESTALMTAVAIMAGAFQNVCRQVDWIRENCAEWVNADRVGTMMCSQISRCLGVLGAASGQFMDSLSPAELASFAGQAPGGQEAPRAAVQTLVQRKTSPFFEIAFVGGWLVGGGELEDPRAIEDLQRAGRSFGTAFQIADDIGDLERDRARRSSGRPGWNYADVFGREEAEAELTRRLAACRKTLTERGLYSPLWDEIYGKVMDMTTA